MSINLLTISAATKSRNFQQAEAELIHIIRYVGTNGFDFATTNNQSDIFSQPSGIDEQVILAFCNQFVTVVSELFSQKSYTPSPNMMYQFTNNKFVIDWIFLGSIWKNSDALIKHLDIYRVNSKGQLRISARNLSVLLMLISASTKFDIDWAQIYQANEQITLETLIGLIGQKYNLLSEASAAGVDKIFQQVSTFPLVKFDNLEFIQLLPNSFFTCSYLDSEHKYKYKKWITGLIKFNIEQSIDTAPLLKQKSFEVPKDRKLKVVVMLEKYNKIHAMYRSFHAVLEAMGESYELIGCGPYNEEEADDLYKPFSSFIPMDDYKDIEGNLNKLSEIDADIIYYPSIGMTTLSVYLSQFRLAPLQIMSGGHPASSCSDQIDKFIFPGKESDYSGLQDYLSEELVLFKDDDDSSYYYNFPSELTIETLEKLNKFKPIDDNKIRVAVNGVVHKVSYKLLQACKKIQQRCNKSVQFVFLSTEDPKSMQGIASKRLVEEQLSNVEFHYNKQYIEYLETVASCDLCLPTYPFGGANSNIDAMLLNKPKVFIKGNKELYTRTDFFDWKSVGLERELGCESVDELIEKTIALIEDPDALETLHARIKEANVVDKLFVNESKNNLAFLTLFSYCIEQSAV